MKWPCQVRSYWLSLQPFIKFVRFLLRYVTPFIIILGKECHCAARNFRLFSYKVVTPVRTGVLLNTVSFSLLSTPVLCDSNLSLYLSALALSDNGALIFNYAVSVAKSHSTFVNDLFMVNMYRYFAFLSNLLLAQFFFLFIASLTQITV